ncbi:hypothetical protein Pelo_18230 [Pelomyxa schiedti]|nr:hypothetical protein Pelo_18230 [Pelomyxa schiedti]
MERQCVEPHLIGHERLSNLHLFITGARDATDYRCYSYSCESDKQKTVVEWITSRVIESHLCEPMVGKKGIDHDGSQRVILPASETLIDLFSRLVDDLLDEKMPAERVRFKMDAKQHLMLSLRRRTTVSQGCPKYSLHIMGIQDLANKDRAIYVYPDIWRNNANIILSILHQNLTRMFLPVPRDMLTGTAKNHYRYTKLYLTFDNA